MACRMPASAVADQCNWLGQEKIGRGVDFKKSCSCKQDILHIYTCFIYINFNICFFIRYLTVMVTFYSPLGPVVKAMGSSMLQLALLQIPMIISLQLTGEIQGFRLVISIIWGHVKYRIVNEAERKCCSEKNVCYINDQGISILKSCILFFQVFDSQGSFLSYVNTLADPLYGPQGMTLTPDGHIFVADSGNHCFKVYKYLQ